MSQETWPTTARGPFLGPGLAVTQSHLPRSRQAFLGIDNNLMCELHVILQTLSCRYPIDADNLQEYCLNVANHFVTVYPWFYMPQTMHKILIHGHDVVRRMVLPMGMLSEEAQEARNKDFKVASSFRESPAANLRQLTSSDVSCVIRPVHQLSPTSHDCQESKLIVSSRCESS